MGGMNTNESHQVAHGAKRIETWEQLQARLFRLAELGEELSVVAAGPVTTWLYREIETEAGRAAEVAGAYIDECERLDRAPHGGDGLAWRGPASARGTADAAAALPVTRLARERVQACL